MFIENVTGGGPPIYGLNGLFKVNWAVNTQRGRRGSQAIHLGIAKPQVVEVISPFTALLKGQRVDPYEFEYFSPNKLLYLTNLTECSGIVLHPDNTYAIPISYEPGEGGFTNGENPPEL